MMELMATSCFLDEQKSSGFGGFDDHKHRSAEIGFWMPFH